MNSCIGFLKMSFKGELQYRGKAISGVATQFFWGLMYVYLYTAFMTGNIIEGFSIPQMATYVWLGQSFYSLRYISLPKNSAKEIENGNVCYKFVRPIALYNQWYFESLGEKIASTLLRFSPIIIVTIFLPKNVGFSLPANFGAFMVFLLLLGVSAGISIAFSMFAVVLSFKTMAPKASRVFVHVTCGVFGGMIVPVPLMPKSIQNVLNYLPFRFLSDTPFRVYIGNIGVVDGLISFAIGLTWLMLLILLGKLLLKFSLKKVVIQGG